MYAFEVEVKIFVEYMIRDVEYINWPTFLDTNTCKIHIGRYTNDEFISHQCFYTIFNFSNLLFLTLISL